eukprot:CAMPEP_0183372400 /NCGR_PEP_ID=MMETSP0164_2-20130417/108338_1 /TAXON_ID=221442 /ORGANISM="Coccolithus pelagicus ssp braarudi, Strain PLY182g" /LENGTH=80 /DNA_ID=CAMNT_0025549095 /DNA_START=85 /DNA_END=327 /DNA_ORIENTATION=+
MMLRNVLAVGVALTPPSVSGCDCHGMFAVGFMEERDWRGQEVILRGSLCHIVAYRGGVPRVSRGVSLTPPSQDGAKGSGF